MKCKLKKGRRIRKRGKGKETKLGKFKEMADKAEWQADREKVRKGEGKERTRKGEQELGTGKGGREKMQNRKGNR